MLLMVSQSRSGGVVFLEAIPGSQLFHPYFTTLLGRGVFADVPRHLSQLSLPPRSDRFWTVYGYNPVIYRYMGEPIRNILLYMFRYFQECMMYVRIAKGVPAFDLEYSDAIAQIERINRYVSRNYPWAFADIFRRNVQLALSSRVPGMD